MEANLPETEKKPEALNRLLDNTAEASKNARRIYIIYVSFLLYCALTVVSISDRQIILNDAVSLPILRMDVPLNGFFILAPSTSSDQGMVSLPIFLHKISQALDDLSVPVHEIEIRE